MIWCWYFLQTKNSRWRFRYSAFAPWLHKIVGVWGRFIVVRFHYCLLTLYSYFWHKRPDIPVYTYWEFDVWLAGSARSYCVVPVIGFPIICQQRRLASLVFFSFSTSHSFSARRKDLSLRCKGKTIIEKTKKVSAWRLIPGWSCVEYSEWYCLLLENKWNMKL